MSDWLDKAYKLQNEVDHISEILYNFGCSFGHTGNDRMRNSMFHLSASLDVVSEELQEITSMVVNDGYKSAQQNTASILNAALAGVKIGKKE